MDRKEKKRDLKSRNREGGLKGREKEGEIRKIVRKK